MGRGKFLDFADMLLAKFPQPGWLRRTKLGKVIAKKNAKAARCDSFVDSFQKRFLDTGHGRKIYLTNCQTATAFSRYDVIYSVSGLAVTVP